MGKFEDRLREAMDMAGRSVADLAKVLVSPTKGTLGVSAQAVYAALRGESRSMTAENVARAARYLGVDYFWLATGVGPRVPADARADIGTLLQALGAHLASMPQDYRQAVADNMAGWARTGGSDQYRVALEAMLNIGPTPRKRGNGA
jgi:transcriptional regulator with XRE-family HTH domain